MRSFGECVTVYHKVLNKNVHITLGTVANKQGKIIAENVFGKKVDFQFPLILQRLRWVMLKMAILYSFAIKIVIASKLQKMEKNPL